MKHICQKKLHSQYDAFNSGPQTLSVFKMISDELNVYDFKLNIENSSCAYSTIFKPGGVFCISRKLLKLLTNGIKLNVFNESYVRQLMIQVLDYGCTKQHFESKDISPVKAHRYALNASPGFKYFLEQIAPSIESKIAMEKSSHHSKKPASLQSQLQLPLL